MLSAENSSLHLSVLCLNCVVNKCALKHPGAGVGTALMLLLIATSLLSGQSVQSESNLKPGRPITIADLIRMKTFGDPHYLNGESATAHLAHFSPDGKKFVVVLKQGDIQRNGNKYSLLLWNSDQVLDGSSPGPTTLFSMVSTSNRPAIQDVKWLFNGEGIAFLGENPGESTQVYIFNLRTLILKQLTHHASEISSYSISSTGEEVAYIAEGPDRKDADVAHVPQETIVGSSQSLADLVSGSHRSNVSKEKQVFIQKSKGPLQTIDIRGIDPRFPGEPQLSPNGQYLIIRTGMTVIPDIWKEYSEPLIHSIVRRRLGPGQYSVVQRYMLVNIATREERILLNAPISFYGSDVAWAPDSRSVALSEVYLPLENTTGNERRTRATTTFAVQICVPNGLWVPIIQGSSKDFREGLSLPAWDPITGNLTFQRGRFYGDRVESLRRVKLRKNGTKWERIDNSGMNEDRPQIVAEEDVNTPPKIVALNPTTHRRTVLLDLNPDFALLKFGRVKEVTWINSQGIAETGGLYYPLNFEQGNRYPLVIQTHGWKRFRFGDAWSTAFAAPALAAEGIMVLQVGENSGRGEDWIISHLDTPEEVDGALADYEGAIDELATKGLIDLDRLGLVGFSRTCLYVKYALTHSRYHFSAASVTDGIDGGYFAYLSFPGSRHSSEGFNGGPPFGDGLQEWIRRSPSFEISKVATPVRIVALNPTTSLMGEWEWFAALSRLGKPVELVCLKDGSHILQKPLDRLISQQGNVDWFDFWLNSHEDPDPSKQEQYARWRAMIPSNKTLSEKQENSR